MNNETTVKPDANQSRMRGSFLRLFPIVLGLLAIAVVIAWKYGLLSTPASMPPANAINIIAPYQYEGTWVFDDSKVGLVRAPFVVGVHEMIDVLVKDIPKPEAGFLLLFSAKQFPGYQKKLTWLRGHRDGNYYELDEPKMEGWICPALFKYFEEAPKELYIQAEEKSK